MAGFPAIVRGKGCSGCGRRIPYGRVDGLVVPEYEPWPIPTNVFPAPAQGFAPAAEPVSITIV